MSARDPDLPILDELGAEFQALVAVTYGAERRPTALAAAERPRLAANRSTVRRRAAPAPSRARRERGAQARRIGRRAAIVLVLICLIGGVAFAALRGGGSSGHAHTTPALLGRDAGGAWSFSVYRDGGRLCTVFVPRGGELSGSCGAPPGHGRLRAASAIAAGRRYVFGLAGQGVARASASLTTVTEVGASRTGVAVRHPVGPGTASDAGLPAGDGWFVLDLGPVGRGQATAPAVVTPLTRHGHPVGRPYVDCSLGVLSPACVRRIESAARG